MNRSYKNTYNLWGLFNRLEDADGSEQSKILSVIISILKIDPTVYFDFNAIENVMSKGNSIVVRTKAFNALALVGYFQDDTQPSLPFGDEEGER